MATYSTREYREIIRASLLDRIALGRPAIISLVAPAGFGKTTLVRQLLENVEAFAICDCRGVDSGFELARRLIPALADETPDRAASLSQSEGMLSDGADMVDRIGIALAAWRVRTRAAVFVFENAEDALAVPAVRDLLTHLLSNRPSNRTVVICSRESLRMQVSRFAAPHHILTLRAADLAFTENEIERLFADADASKRTLKRIMSISSGWPIAVLLLARFSYERRLEELLDKLDDMAFGELYEYLAEQVVDFLAPALLDALIACTGIPHPTLRDISFAQPDPLVVQQFEEFAKTWPFVSCSGSGIYTMHPFLATLLSERYAHRVTFFLERAAKRYEADGEWLRAADLHLARGDQEAAARALNGHEVTEDQAPPIAYSRVLASLNHKIVLRYPRLWVVSTLLRAFSGDVSLLLREAEGVWEALPLETLMTIRVPVFIFRVLYMSYLGDFEKALAVIDAFRMENGMMGDPQTKLQGWMLLIRSLMLSRLWRLEEARQGLEGSWPFVHGTYVLASSSLVAMGCDIARVRGDREGERKSLEHSMEIMHESGLSNFIGFNHAEATFGAWLAGDEGDFLRHAFTLEAEVERESLHGFSFFASCARRRPGKPGKADLLRYIVCGYLIACCDANDRANAYGRAEEAFEAAQKYRAPFFCLLAALAVAETGPPEDRIKWIEEVPRYAAEIDSVPLREAVAAWGDGRPAGFLRTFIERLRRERQGEEHGILIELLTGKVLRGKRDVELSGRELQVLLVCALRPEALTREFLTDLLWPDLSEASARNAFHVCLHRLKHHLGENVIVHTREGYRLRNDARVDLWEIDRLMPALRANGVGDETMVRDLFERLKESRPARFAQWEWFEATERHLRDLRSEVAHMLAQYALARKRYGEALALSGELIAYDSCDESAHELAISAYIAMEDRPAALRHFSQYSRTLKAELDCEPSASLSRLVGDQIVLLGC